MTVAEWERAGDGCTCWVNPNPFRYGSAVEPGDALAPDFDCPEHFPTAPAFKPTHRVRKRGDGEWVEVRSDGVEPQTYYDRSGSTIYAGIWFPHMQVERLPEPLAPTTGPA